MSPPPLRLATRRSRQATAQSTAVAEAISAATGRDVELVGVETVGDRTQAAEVPLHEIGGQGVFVKEIQRAVLDGRADLAVHSAKDLPSVTEPGLTIAAYGRRRDPRDALIGRGLADLADGATVATGSVRRRSQLVGARPDLRFVELRGNIDTRLTRLPDDGAIVMAVAALEILDLVGHVAETLDPHRFVPAIGQGAVAVEVRADDAETLAAVSEVDHAPTRRSVEIERAFLAELGVGCSAPVGAYADGSTLRAFLAADVGVPGVVRSIDLESTADGSGDPAVLDADRDRAARLAREMRDHPG